LVQVSSGIQFYIEVTCLLKVMYASNIKLVLRDQHDLCSR